MTKKCFGIKMAQGSNNLRAVYKGMDFCKFLTSLVLDLGVLFCFLIFVF